MRPDRFCIIGMPRSRTSWLASLFTFGPCFCMHDGLAGGNDFFRRLEGIASRHHEIRHIGNSDSGIPLLLKPSDVGGARFIIVLRSPDDSRRSYVHYFSSFPYRGLPLPDRDFFQTAYDKLRDFDDAIPEPMKIHVTFEDLDKVEVVRRAWSFVCPDEEFNEDRFKMLDKLRINPASEKVVWS